MITIRANSSSVEVILAHKVNGREWVHVYQRVCAGEFDAAHLARSLDRALRGAVEGVVRDAYEEGWRDAKAHRRAKRTWWSDHLPVVES